MGKNKKKLEKILNLQRYIVGSCNLMPDNIACMKWGGFIKDIKGRETMSYQFATSGNKQIYIWKFNAKNGHFENEFINTGSTIRDYLCIEFSKPNQEYLYAGTSSGDFCTFQMKNKILSSIITVAPLGVTSIHTSCSSILHIGCGNGSFVNFSIDGPKLTQKNQVSLFGSIKSISSSSDGSQCIVGTDKGEKTIDMNKLNFNYFLFAFN